MSTPAADMVQGPSGRIRAMVEEIIAGTPVFIVDVSVRGQKGSQAVDVFVDSDDGLDVEEIARISRELGHQIELEEVLPGRYNLTVSTPGVDRPLKMPRQYRKNVGRTLQVHFEKADGSGNTEITGELLEAKDDGIVVEDPKDGPQEVAFDRILWSKVKLPW